ncbi:DUF6875 domain-containing protein [Bosea eneae]|jgi:hypothetical protein|uniref:DUF6875 domain-containing protein n=1 Tax=Bosea eneae TaxID=151454 RepID=A0ABW0IY64_9HYPH
MAIVAQEFLTFSKAKSDALNAGPADALAKLVGWIETYLMTSNDDLGRAGAVCPFTRQAARIDTARIAVCRAEASDEAAVYKLIRASFKMLDNIPAKAGMEHFRTVVIGFPHCAEEEGIKMLRRVQDGHKFYSLARNRMIGLMYPASEAPGLWNPAFRPLRAPLPVLAIRHMVEQDAPFAARHLLLLAPYLLRFPLAGTKRLFAHAHGGLKP